MDTILILGILLAFGTALVGAYLQRRGRDRALRTFDGFHGTAELESGKRVWGRVRVYPNGLELVFNRTHRTGNLLDKASYIIFQEQLKTVLAVRRYHDELTPTNQAVRREQIDRAFHPDTGRRLARSARNFLNTFRDAFSDSIGLVLSRVKAAGRSDVVSTHDKRLKQLGDEALGSVGNAFDPILEHYIGYRVVAEISRPDGKVVEHGGVLQEYSPQWLCLLDCREFTGFTLPLSDPERLRFQRSLDFHVTREGARVRIGVENRGAERVFFKGVRGPQIEVDVNRALEPGDSVEAQVALPEAAGSAADPTPADPATVDLVAPERETAPVPGNLTALALPPLELLFEAPREVDLILPRGRTVVRHGGESVAHRYLPTGFR